MSWWTYHGDCVSLMAQWPENGADAVVCDPPYGLEFMGKEWDSLKAPTGGARFTSDGMGKGFRALPSFKGSPNPSCLNCKGSKRGRDRKGFKRCVCASPLFPNSGLMQSRQQQVWHLAWATEALRALKPGGHLVAFGGSRTYHRLACALEDAGFELRDSLMWLYGTGFPKSLDVGKAFDKAAGVRGDEDGNGTRETNNTLDGGILKNRCGACGKPFFSANACQCPKPEAVTDLAKQWEGWGTALKPAFEPIVLARKPLEGTVAANVQKWGTGALNIDGCRIETQDKLGGGAYSPGVRPSGLPGDDAKRDAGVFKGGVERKLVGQFEQPEGRWPANVVLDEEAGAMLDVQSGDVSRFFYCAKTSRTERGEGNNHPTVKPIALMRWLVRLVTPPGGLVVDPFMGSGTTGIAACLEKCRFVGIERDAAYFEIAKTRIAKGAIP